jgi:adenylate kinase
LYVNILDSVTSTHKNLEADAQWRARLTQQEIATWRDEETFLTEVLAQFQKKRLYIVPVEEICQTLVDLITKPAIKKIYLSYPITAILKRDPKLLEAARKFAEDLRKKYVVFNPLAIKDLMGDEKDESGVMSQLRQNTVWRDFKLIDQSDMVVVYYPVEENSPGVNQEVMHGYTHDKDVYLFTPHRPSPFWDPQIAVTKRFDRFEELRDFLLSE